MNTVNIKKKARHKTIIFCFLKYIFHFGSISNMIRLFFIPYQKKSEDILPNGIVQGHAYTVSGVFKVSLHRIKCQIRVPTD